MTIAPIGFGGNDFNIAIYIANRPPIDSYPQLNTLHGLATGELAHITANCSNHWRKIFNVYAKFLLAFDNTIETDCDLFKRREITRWQDYRDKNLLQSHSREALLFSPPNLANTNAIHIIAGKTYANDLNLNIELTWLDNYFAINKQYNLIVSPYLDYRQLSNARIEQLANLVKQCLRR